MDCLKNLVGIRQICAADSAAPLFWLDDIEGIDRATLADVASQTTPSGLQTGLDLLDSASRLLYADIETAMPKGYSIRKVIQTHCHQCNYTSMMTTATNTGVIVKNNSTSYTSFLLIDSLRVMIQNTGNYTLVLDDGIAAKNIPCSFTSGVELSLVNIAFTTYSRIVKIYILESSTLIALTCPSLQGGCGCSGYSGGALGLHTDVKVTGLLNGAEFATLYSVIPCVSVICSLERVLCNVIALQPNLFALTLLYRVAAKYFSEFQVTTRINRTVNTNEAEKKNLADVYLKLYNERLHGSDAVRGITTTLSMALEQLHDRCVECKRMNAIGWATT